MIMYRYTAKDIYGRTVRGRMETSSETQAYDTLRSQDLFVVRLKAERPRRRVKRMDSRRLAEFANQLSVMTGSGIALVQSLNIMAQRENRSGIVGIYRDIYIQLIRGNTLSDALEQQRGVFPSLLIGLARAGETGGRLSESMREAADYYEKDNRLQKKVIGAMLYPAFLFILAVCSVIVIFTVVLPNFFVLFESAEELPWSTRLLMGISRTLTESGGVIWAWTAALLLIAIYVINLAGVKFTIDRLKTSVPVMGTLMRRIYTARFSRTLSSLYSNGVPFVNAVGACGDVVDNRYIKAQFPGMLEKICNGVPLSAAIEKVDGFDARLSDSIYIGEESGSLDVVLDDIASEFEEEADNAANRIATLIEPVMIVAMAVVIGFILMSVMLPIYQYYQSIG